MKNPLITAILALLKEHLGGISEFEILNVLKDQFPEFKQLAEDANLQLFRQHFLIMNALYQLQESLWQDEQLVLSITALEISLLPASPVDQASGMEQASSKEHASSKELGNNVDAKLAAYYLDWTNYKDTDETEVSNLISSFYQRMDLEGDKQNALKVLKITTLTPSKVEIKQQYRKLAQLHHPDTGGNPETFIEIRQAYEQLTR